MQLLGKIMGDPNKRDLKAIQPIVDKINALEPAIKKLSDEELAAKTVEFRAQLALYLKGGMVLEDELVKLFREALSEVEPLAERLSEAQLHAAMREPRQVIERHRTPEYDLRENLAHTLSEAFEGAYQNLSAELNRMRAAKATRICEERGEWPDEAEDAQAETLKLLAEIEPALAEVDEEFQAEAFEQAWPRFEAVRNSAGDNDDLIIDNFERMLENILRHLEPEIVALKAEQMDQLTGEMAKRYRGGKTLDDLLPEAFAVTREAARRTIKMRHYDVQLIGGIVLHQGKIAEMRTGEGKTLVATLPIYLNALTGKGVHLVTVNDYLAQRDAEWMGQVYKFLGLTVGIIINAVDPLSPARRAAYEADITYGTNNEFGFDYLRDNMAMSLEQTVQRELNYAIVDEVDNILIDEARTPLIISGQGEESTEHYARFAQWAKLLKPEEDYTVDEKTRTVILTEAGIDKIERKAGLQNIYDERNIELTRYMENAIKAQVIFKRDRDYIIKDGEVVIVDEFTGRQLPGRRYSEGLHQAIEAKEGVKVQRENHTLATITFQNYFRLYKKLAGMTGTALTDAEEFDKIYKLDVVVIPTHKPMIRKDQPDLIYRTTEAKFRAVVEEIKERHAKGQPVLVGTTAVETSEYLSDLLEREGIPHNVLNAKHHAREAQIVAQAGRSGAVTIATNMAGRGTDILLGGNPTGYLDSILRKHAEQVDFIREMPERTPDEREEKEEAIQDYIAHMSEEEKEKLLEEKVRECEEDHKRVVELGGLYIIGTERHESRRIDKQLRGRAGRQGDPGESRFFLSLEDELLRRFVPDMLSKIMQRVGLEEDVPLEHSLVSNVIEKAQTKVEGYNFDQRKNVVDYDDVIARQREVIYADRRAVLEHADLHERILGMIRAEVSSLVDKFIPGTMVTEEEQLEQLFATLEQLVPVPEEVVPENIHAVRREDLKKELIKLVLDHYELRARQIDEQHAELRREHPDLPPYSIRDLERAITFQVVDRLWMDHIDALDVMRASIHFRSVGQRDPLVEFKNEAYRMFEELKAAIQHYIVVGLLQNLRNEVRLQVNQPEPKRKAPRNVRTNADAIAKASGQVKSDTAEERTRSNGHGQPARRNGSGQRPGNRRAAAPTASRPVATRASSGPGTPPARIGRNDLCYCGSGKKYKKCHGA
jgi:preprotein translocase subunit SecA